MSGLNKLVSLLDLADPTRIIFCDLYSQYTQRQTIPMSNKFETLVTQLTCFLEDKNSDELIKLIEQRHPAELGRLIESLPSKYREDFCST